MIEQASVCWYRVGKCGYFRSSRANAPEFGSLPQAVADLAAWSVGKQLPQTQTFDPAVTGEDDAQLPVYLLDVRGAADNWLITLWNETPATEGQVASVPTNATVGETRVVMNPLAPDTIPGTASYFLVVPSLSAVAAIRFQHLSFGHAAFRRYMSGFMRLATRHVCWSDTPDADGNLELLGYSNAPTDDPQDLIPFFKSEVLKQGGEREQLLQRARDIRKIVRRSELQNGRRPDLQLWQQMLRKVGMAPPQEAPPAVKIQYEIYSRVELAQLNVSVRPTHLE